MKFKPYADNSSDEFWHLLYLGLLLTQYLHDSECGTYSICQFSGTQMFNYKQKENLYTKAKCNVLKKSFLRPNTWFGPNVFTFL